MTSNVNKKSTLFNETVDNKKSTLFNETVDNKKADDEKVDVDQYNRDVDQYNRYVSVQDPLKSLCEEVRALHKAMGQTELPVNSTICQEMMQKCMGALALIVWARYGETAL